MITVKDVIKELQMIVDNNPPAADFPVIYSADDEGNAYMKVNFLPSFCEVEDVNERYLERIETEDGATSIVNANTVIIN